jgi:hypothetical protein
MTNQLVAFIVDESKWLTASMALALLPVAILLYRRRAIFPTRLRITTAMNLFFGVMVGTMAFGHLLAVTTKLAMGTLEGSLLFFSMIGIVLAVPSWLLIHHACRLLTPHDTLGRRTLVLNVWLALTLLALGVHNLPLAAPAVFNIAYQQHSRPAVGWTIVTLAVMVNLGLFIGSLIFMASGQSFEQFKGIE